MPQVESRVVLPLVVVLGTFFIGWYLVGNEIMRRHARRLAIWSKRTLDPLGGTQAVQWLTLHAFRLEVEGAAAPFQRGSLTGLTESWDVPMIWLWNRLRGRRDMVLAQMTLHQQPLWGFEVYRPGSLLSKDSRHLARLEGWEEQPLGELMVAAAGDAPRQLAGRLVAELGDYRSRLVRLAVRRAGPHLTLALTVPERGRPDPLDFQRLLQRVARAALRPEADLRPPPGA